MRTYTVRPGDCMTSIARAHGFADPAVIYDHPANAELREARPNMHVLHPGDTVVIPDVPRKQVPCPTEARHRFSVRLPTKRLVLVLVDARGRPRAQLPYTLEVLGRRFQGETGDDGTIAHDVDARATRGTLQIGRNPPALLRIGHLNPMRRVDDDGVSGALARLHNLGYGAVGDTLDRSARAALRHFRRAAGLAATDAIDEALVAKLEKAHGC